jgi:AmmeMemoRadiSam system protein A
MKKNELIKALAWSGIKSQLGIEKLIEKYDVVKEYPEFVKAGATFITLKKNGNLRGCIGSLIAQNELYNDLVINARKAAFNDPRFKPVQKEELAEIDLEVSLLTPAILVKYDSIEDLKSKIDVGIDGIVLKLGEKQSTFLPQVWDDLPTFELFFERLCLKGGMESTCLEKHPLVYKYQVEKIR